MRVKLGRPDISQYASFFDVPESTDGGLSVTFMGVATLLISDGESALLTDGYFTRASLPRIALGRLAPDLEQIGAGLRRLGTDPIRAVLPVHTHFDHALDSAVVAQRTGALLVGGESTANLGRGAGLPEEKLRILASGESLDLDSFRVTLIASDHCPPDRYPGVITDPVVPPVRAGAYRCGEAWSLVVRHSAGRSVLVQGSAGFVPGALGDVQAEVAYLGVGQLGVQTEEYIRRYWAETVEAVGARQVVLIHWDDFFRTLDKPLRALPYAGDDLEVTMRVFTELSTAQGVTLSFPTVGRRENPWADLDLR